MKQIILSADNSLKLYSVPDVVADNLVDYICDFNDWLDNGKEANKYHHKIDGVICVCYNETVLFIT